MRNYFSKRGLGIACAMILTTVGAAAQDHKWAGRTLDDLEWAVHERLAVLPYHGVFDLLAFEVQGNSVILTGQVTKEIVKNNAERAVRQVPGVENVVNRIEVLPPSRRDDVLRQNVYRAIYEKQPLDKYGMRAAPPIQIIVKNGWVTLEGVVDSDRDRTMAHLHALTVTGHISDNLRVAPEE